MKPIIGITVDAKPDASERTGGKLELNWNYAEAVAEAGGVPILIPPHVDAPAVAEILHGWLIPGGLDIDAANWGEANHPASKVIPAPRFDGEKRLMAAIDPQLPVLGICYGCQFINVARGGSLDQHIPDLPNRKVHTDGPMQEYDVEPESLLAKVLGGAHAEGKSYHHQAIGRLGQGLNVVAKESDGTIEAVEALDRPWMVGVQWHPERTREDPAMQSLFREFVRACADYAQRRR